MPQFFAETQNINPLVMPVVQYVDGSYAIDSTPIIEKLESQTTPERTIHPADPALNFLSHLIEDFADEWLTKCLFHYRFSYPADRDYGPRWVMDDSYPQASVEALNNYHKRFLERQTERMPLVGCVPAHKVLFEDCYHELLAALEPYVALEKFLFGTRPSLADFGLFGQLKTLSIDPTPRSILRAKAPRLDTWLMRMDDTSGVEGDFCRFEEIDEVISKLTTLIREIYLPYLAANNSAFNAGGSSFTTVLRGHEYTQSTFKYQVKCLRWLQERYTSLAPIEREKLRPYLGETHVLSQ